MTHDPRDQVVPITDPSGKDSKNVPTTAGLRKYDARYKGRDVEYKSDNFSRGPRSQESLKRMQAQIEKDALNAQKGGKPHWHFEHDPSKAPDMKPVLDALNKNKIPWSWGSAAPF